MWKNTDLSQKPLIISCSSNGICFLQLQSDIYIYNFIIMLFKILEISKIFDPIYLGR
jgi:hypothetical protein